MNVELQTIVKCLSIFILYDNVVNDSNSIKIREILYKHNGHWKLRDLSEFATSEEPETRLPIYKLFIDVPMPKVKKAEAQWIEFVNAGYGEVLDEIKSTGAVSDDAKKQLTGAMEAFRGAHTELFA